MKVGINGYYFSVGHTGGTEIYFRNLISCLNSYPGNNQYWVFVDQKWHNEFSGLGEHIRLMPLYGRPSIWRRLLYKYKIISPSSSSYIASQARSLGLDLVHSAYSEISLSLSDVRTISTIFDLQHKALPEYFSPLQLANRERDYSNAVKVADRIITISKYSAGEISKFYPVSSKNVDVTYISYDEDLFSLPTNGKVGKLPDKYILYPAARWPHKNHERLFYAFKTVADSHPDMHLVLTGVALDLDKHLNKLIIELSLQGRIHFEIFLDRNEMPKLYANAQCMIFPSLYEGFGIPILESMAMGCPVACSNTTSLPEVGGDAVIYFDPISVEEMTRAMIALIDDKTITSSMVERGFKQIKKFTLENMAEQTVRAYEKTIL